MTLLKKTKIYTGFKYFALCYHGYMNYNSKEIYNYNGIITYRNLKTGEIISDKSFEQVLSSAVIVAQEQIKSAFDFYLAKISREELYNKIPNLSLNTGTEGSNLKDDTAWFFKEL